MADKKVALGKKASEIKQDPKKVEKVLSKKTEEKKAKPALGKKAALPVIKVEVKEVPAIAHFEKKEVIKKDTTAKLPAKPSGVADKMAKLKTSLKKVVHEAHEPDDVEEVKPLINDPSPSTSTSVTQLDIASTRRPVASVKKGPVAAGKVSFEELINSQAPAVQAPQIPFFDVEKYLKK